jgi:hypothetical protein
VKIDTFVKSLNFTDHNPIRIGDERERLATAPVMIKNWSISWEEQFTGERPRETAET